MAGFRYTHKLVNYLHGNCICDYSDHNQYKRDTFHEFNLKATLWKWKSLVQISKSKNVKLCTDICVFST